MSSDTPTYPMRQRHGNRVAKLSHRFGPRTMKSVPIGKRLKSCGLTNGKVPNGAIRHNHHVLAARNPMVTSFEGFGGKIEWATGMAGIGSCPGLKGVIVKETLCTGLSGIR